MKKNSIALMLVLAALVLLTAACDSQTEDPLQAAVTRAAAELGQEAAADPQTAVPEPAEVTPAELTAAETVEAAPTAVPEPTASSSETSESQADETADADEAPQTAEPDDTSETAKMEQEARTIAAAADGSGEFAGLAEAAAAAAPGSTIELAAGDYELAETLAVSKALTIRGAGVEESRIISTAGTAVLSFEGNGTLVVEDLTLISAAAADSGDVIYVNRGALQLANCRVQGAKQSADGNFGAGLFVEGEAQIDVTNCEIAGNQGVGIESFGEAVVNVQESTLSGNGTGMLFDSSSSGTISSSEITRNEGGGVLLFGHAEVQFNDNSISGNLDIGLQYRLTGGSAGVASGNELLDNDIRGMNDPGTDILIVGEFAPDLQGNSCSSETPPPDAQTGIVVDPSGIVLLSEGVSIPGQLVSGENDCAFTVCAVVTGDSGPDIQCLGS